jgi:hypothetical protein
VKVSIANVIEWMATLVAESARQDAAEHKEADPRKLNWKGSRGWLKGFLKRYGWVRRLATNKRSHGAEDLLGDVLGFILFLAELRRANPSDKDPVWGVFGPLNTFNGDSVPLSFCSTSRTTLERNGAVRVSIIVPGSRLDKRQATLHLVIRPWGIQPHPTIILRMSSTAEGKPDTKKRKAEMEKFSEFKVHVL